MKNLLVGLLFLFTLPIWALPAALFCLAYLLSTIGEDLIEIYKGMR